MMVLVVLVTLDQVFMVNPVNMFSVLKTYTDL